MSDGGVVVDASAVLALLLGEPITNLDKSQIAAGYISTVNLAEVLTKLRAVGNVVTPSEALGALDLRIVPFDEGQARRTAEFWPLTRRSGLSLGDRACLALGAALKRPVATADRAWARIKGETKIILIR